jgi:hypothetical protein
VLGASGSDDRKLFEHLPRWMNSSSMRRATTGLEITTLRSRKM